MAEPAFPVDCFHDALFIPQPLIFCQQSDSLHAGAMRQVDDARHILKIHIGIAAHQRDLLDSGQRLWPAEYRRRLRSCLSKASRKAASRRIGSRATPAWAVRSSEARRSLVRGLHERLLPGRDFTSHCLPDSRPRDIQGLREHPRLAHHLFKIGVGYPAGQHVHGDVPGDSGPGGLPDIHAQVDAIGTIKLSQTVSMRWDSAIISPAASRGSFRSSSKCV